MTKLEFLTFDDKLEAAWGLHKTANEHLKIRIDKLTDENERLRKENQKLRDALTLIQCKAHDTLRPIPFQDEE